MGMWSTIAGVVLGFALGKAADVWTHRRENRAVKKNVRVLISLETQGNALALQQYWSNVSARADKWRNEEGEFAWGLLATESVAVSLPEFSAHSWLANLSQAPTVFTATELENLWQTYGTYRRIARTWSHIAALSSQRRETERNVELQQSLEGLGGMHMLGGLVGALEFGDRAILAAKELAAAIESIIGTDTVAFPESGTQQFAAADRHPATRAAGG